MKTVLQARLVLLMFTLMAGVASATTVQAGSGTLTYTEKTTVIDCTYGDIGKSSYDQFQFSAFSYTISGVTTPLPEGYVYANTPAPKCDIAASYPALGWDIFTTPAFPFTSQTGTAITFSTEYDTATGTATALTPGIIYPKFQVQSIIYSAPGNDSSSGFTNSTTDGTTMTVGSSFAAGDTFTFSLSGGFLGTGSTLSWDFGNSATTGNSTADTETITDAAGVAIAGPGSSGLNVINHEQDWFIVWVNPAVVVYQTGLDAVGYAQGTQLQTTGDPSPGEPEAYQDQVEVQAQAMMANASGATTVPLDALIPVKMVDGETLPGLAVVCANPTYYPSSCTLANQCGCVPSDFAPILAQDPLLKYSSTESPLNADTSGATICESPAATSSCRYVPVPSAPGSSVQQVELLSGPDETGGTRPINSFTQTDSNTTTQTLSESDAYTVGSSTEESFKFLGTGISIKTANQWTWTDSESTGEINGHANAMAVSLSSATVDCYQEIPIFEDTVYHTFVFSQPTGNTSCP
jgi:hypothetical protein